MDLVVKPIKSIPGAFACSDGTVKFPEVRVKMPNGGERVYKTKFVKGVLRRASKKAKHVYYGTFYRGKNYKIHRLVCEAFHGKAPFKDAVVIHINENALDNRPENLKWGNQKENLNMPKFIEYCKTRVGENSPIKKSCK